MEYGSIYGGSVLGGKFAEGVVGGGMLFIDNFRENKFTIKITEEGLKHIQERHTYNGIEKWATKSKFFDVTDIKSLIKQSNNFVVRAGDNGNLVRVGINSTDVGVSSLTGSTTNIYTVVTDELNNLLTAHPGQPLK